MTLLATIESSAAPEYLGFLAAQAASVSVGDFVLLYGRSDLPERNETYEVQKYLAGWFTIGDDGGGAAILMRLDGTTAVFRCGHGAIGSFDPEPVSDSFAQWLAEDCPAAWMDDDEDEYDD